MEVWNYTDNSWATKGFYNKGRVLIKSFVVSDLRSQSRFESIDPPDKECRIHSSMNNLTPESVDKGSYTARAEQNRL